MAEGQTEDLRSVTQVTPATPNQTAGGVGAAVDQIITQSQQAKIQQNASQAQLDISALNNKYQIDNQSDPFANLGDLKEKRQQILDNYGSQISPFFGRDWQMKAQELNANGDANIQAWGLKQSQENTVLGVNTALRNTFMGANNDGESYGTNGGDLSTMLNFANAKANILDYGTQHLGATTTADMLFNFDRDYAKSFVAGVAQSNPQKAAILLSQPEIQQHFNTEQIGEMDQLIRSTDKQQQINKNFAMGGNTAQIMDTINDPTLNYFQKRQQIDMMDAQGNISSKSAAQARRLLTSSKNVDAVTDSGTMSDIVTQMYDLNANSSSNNADYLTGVNNLQNKIMTAQADGKLNVLDAQKLNNEMRTLTSAKVSAATNEVGYSFPNATKVFQALPPEMRGEATRQLFYQTTGQQTPLTSDQVTAKAQGIVDNMNNQRRAAALQTVQAPTMAPEDQALLKEKGYSASDVTETAKKYNIPESEVIKRLRAGQ